MSIFSGLRKSLGMTKVVENNGIITVDGLPASDLIRLFNRFIQTSRVTNNIFIRIGSYSFSFFSFYAIEVNFLLLKVLESKPGWGLATVCHRVIEGLQENTWLKNTIHPPKPMVDLTLTKGLTWSLKPHQLEFLKVYGVMVPKYNLRGYLLAASPGAGKTFASLALAAVVIPREIATVKIIISPKNAVDLVWEKTIKEVFKKSPTSWVSTEAGPAPLDREYYVFHYESLPRAIELAQKLIKRKVRYFVAVDESHNFNVLSSQRTQMLIQLCTMTPWNTYQVWSSGTPIKAMSTEVMPLLMCIDPTFTPIVAVQFKKAFSNDRAGAVEIVAHRLGIITYKVPKAEFMDTKPITQEIKIKLDDPTPYLLSTIKADMQSFVKERLSYYTANMTEYQKTFEECVVAHRQTRVTIKQKEAFNQWVSAVNQIKATSKRGGFPDGPLMNFAKTYEDTILIPSLNPTDQKRFKTVRSVVKTLRLKVQGEALGRVGRRRAECSVSLAQNANLLKYVDEAKAKTLIFSSYVKPVETAAQIAEAGGLTPVRVFGDAASDVTRLINEFTHNKNLNPCCATIMSLSTAVPVIAANTVIFLDYPVRHNLYEQAVARVWRMGQTEQVYVYECVLDTGTEPNISTRGADILEWSKEQSELLMGDDMDVDLTGMEFPTA